MLLGELGQVDLSLVDLAAEIIDALDPVGAVADEVVDGLEGELDIFGYAGRGERGRTSPGNARRWPPGGG